MGRHSCRPTENRGELQCASRSLSLRRASRTPSTTFIGTYEFFGSFSFGMWTPTRITACRTTRTKLYTSKRVLTSQEEVWHDTIGLPRPHGDQHLLIALRDVRVALRTVALFVVVGIGIPDAGRDEVSPERSLLRGRDSRRSCHQNLRLVRRELHKRASVPKSCEILNYHSSLAEYS